MLARAEQILTELEAGRHGAVDAGAMADHLPLFDHRQPRVAPKPDALAAALAAIEPDSLTPRAALDLLYRLKELETGADGPTGGTEGEPPKQGRDAERTR